MQHLHNSGRALDDSSATRTWQKRLPARWLAGPSRAHACPALRAQIPVDGGVGT